MGKDNDQEVTQRVQIPGFLRPFAETQASIGLEALRGLAARLSGAPASRFAPPPPPAPMPVRGFGGGRMSRGEGDGGGFLGVPPSALAPPPTEAGPPIPGAAAEDLVAGLTPDQLAAIDLARARAQGGGGFIPTAQQEFLETARGRDIASFIDPAALGALRATAGGEFLFGGQGFREAVDAAVRAAQPHILSTFGGAGRGTGGLAQTAIAQAATDAFARQNLQARQQQLAAAGLLGDFGQAERARQLQAAGALPGLAFADVDPLLRIGGIQQEQAQRELTAPITALESLLGFAGGSIPSSAFLGQATIQPGGGSSLAGGLSGGLGGALTGAKLGSMVPGIGTVGGAVGGGAIGLLGGLFS